MYIFVIYVKLFPGDTACWMATKRPISCSKLNSKYTV